MRIWLSAEASLDTEEVLRLSSNELEAKLNAALQSCHYGSAVDKWAIIFIILSFHDPRYAEIRKFWKKRKVVEFRLKVDHAAFLAADHGDRIKMLGESVLRSIDLSSSLQLGSFSREQFRADVLRALRSIDTTAIRPDE